MQLDLGFLSRLARLLLACLMALAWCGAVPHFASVAWAQPVATADQQRTQKQIGAILAKLARIASNEVSKPGADPADVKAKALELSGDPDRIFKFVRDEIRYEPYRGVLRGADGTLLARAGNSLDKSLLLQAMLEAHGTPCRLIHGELPADKATELVQGFLKADAVTGPLAEAAKDAERSSLDPASVQFVESVAAETGLDVKALTEALNAGQARVGAVAAEAWATVEREAPALSKRLDAAGIKLGQPPQAVMKELEARAARHTWVEIKGPADPEKWVALDPSFAASERGTSYAAGQPRELKLTDEHLVTVKLIYKRTGDNGQAEEQELINVPMPTRLAGFHFPQLVINPAEGLPPASQLTSMTPEQLIKAMGAIKKFQPALRVGGVSYFGQVFDLKGNLYSVAADGRVAGASAVGGAAGGLFGGGALGGGGQGPAKDDDGPGKFLELSVAIDIAPPGEPGASHKRVLLSATDLAGDHKKSAMLTWDILVQPQPMGGKWVANRSVRTLLAALEPMVGIYGSGKMAAKDLDALTKGRPEPHPGLLLNMALMRERAVARQLKENGGVTLLWDGPLVAIGERTFCMNGKAGHACGNSQIDIVDNAIRFIARQPGTDPAAAAQAALRQGVFDTAAEALALRESLNSPGATTVTRVHSPIDDFAQARAAGDALGVFTAAAGAAPPRDVALADADRAWVARHERPGRVIVAPSKAIPEQPSPGWWSIDPLTGSVVGRGAGGRGQAMSEKAIITNLVSYAACMVSPTWDAAFNKPSGNKAAIKLSLQMIGCIVGMTVGFAGGGESMMLIWAITGIFLAGADKALEG